MKYRRLRTQLFSGRTQLGSAEDLQAVSFKEDYTVNSRVLVEGGKGNDDSGVLEVKGKVKRRDDSMALPLPLV
jgi:hypothetical protein